MTQFIVSLDIGHCWLNQNTSTSKFHHILHIVQIGFMKFVLDLWNPQVCVCIESWKKKWWC